MQTSAPISVAVCVALSSELRKRWLDSSSTAALPCRSTFAVPRSSVPSRRNLASASADSSRGSSMAWQRCTAAFRIGEELVAQDALVDLDAVLVGLACSSDFGATSASSAQGRALPRRRRRPAARHARTCGGCRSACRRACAHAGAGRRIGRRVRPACPGRRAKKRKRRRRRRRNRRSRPAPRRSCPCCCSPERIVPLQAISQKP